MNIKYTFKQVAKWFIDKANEDLQDGGIPMTKSKLHKLLYYAKGFYYVFENESFFDGDFMVSKNGVLNKELSVAFKESHDELEHIFNNEKIIKNILVITTLNFVYKKIGKINDENLNEIVKNEEPFVSASNSKKIAEEKIAEIFREKYLTDNLSNKFGINRDEIVSVISFMTYKKYDKAFEVLAQ